MTTTKVFQSGNSQAIRIPKEMRTDKSEFCITKVGEAFVILPVDDPWLALKMTIGTFPGDFLSDREQPSATDAQRVEL